MNDDKIRILIKMGPEIQLVRRRKYDTYQFRKMMFVGSS